MAEGDTVGEGATFEASASLGLRTEASLAEGLADGLADTLADGLADGVTDTLADGLTDALADGVTDGLADGLTETLAELSEELPEQPTLLNVKRPDRISRLPVWVEGFHMINGSV